MASDLAGFLLARIAEDEHFGTHDRHLSKRWPAECEAKRQIVEAYREACEAADSIRETFAEYDHPRAQIERASYNATASAFRTAVEALALPYAEHPDYRQEWKP